MLKAVKALAIAAMLTLGLVSHFAPRAEADNDGKIEGTILDFDGKPWANLGVKIKNDQGSTQETKTDANGKFSFANLKTGRYAVLVQSEQMKQPYEHPADVRGGETASVNLNFKEILEKQNPEAAAQYKKRAEEQQKFSGMKEHFTKGVALLDQEKAAKTDLSKAPADQRDAAKQKVLDLSNQTVAEFQEALKAAPEKDPNQGLFWARMGEAYDLAGRNDEAIHAYQQAVAAKPDNASYFNNLGNVLARAGKIEEARAAYTKSAELDPANAGLAWRNFGISLYQVDRKSDAIAPLQKATQLDPKNPQGWYLLATCMVADPSVYKQVGDKIEVTPLPGTIEAYQKAIELDPNGTWGLQAKAGLEQLQQMTGGIETKTGTKKKKP
jgi:tetratricopeptide (TPR) repeat protein